jgi:hypothetical protein
MMNRKGNKMSCVHGNHEDDCDICAEVDAAWNSGYASGIKDERAAMAVMVEEQQRMAKRIEELESQLLVAFNCKS